MKKLFILSLLVVFTSINTLAIDYDDGQEHDINTPLNDSIYIYNAADPTVVNLVSGGVVSSVDVYDTSIFNLFSGGEVLSVPSGSDTVIDYSFISHNDSQDNMWGGTARAIYALDNSFVEMWDGGLHDGIGALGNSHVVMRGGYTHSIGAAENGHLTMLGGLAGDAFCYDNSQLEISGVTLRSLNVEDSGRAIVTDSHFDYIPDELRMNSSLSLTIFCSLSSARTTEGYPPNVRYSSNQALISFLLAEMYFLFRLISNHSLINN